MSYQSSNANSTDARRPLKIEGADPNEAGATGTFSLDTPTPNTAPPEYPATSALQGIKDPAAQWTERAASSSQPPIEGSATLQPAQPEPLAQPSSNIIPFPAPLRATESAQLPAVQPEQPLANNITQFQPRPPLAELQPQTIIPESQPKIEPVSASGAPSPEVPLPPRESLLTIFNPAGHDTSHMLETIQSQASSLPPQGNPEALQAPQLAVNPDTAIQEHSQIKLAPEAAQPVTSSSESLDLPPLEPAQSPTGDIANVTIEDPTINPSDSLSATASSDQPANNPDQTLSEDRQQGSILPFSILQKKPEEHIVSNQPTSRLMQALPGQGDHKNAAFWGKAQEAKKGQKKAA